MEGSSGKILPNGDSHSHKSNHSFPSNDTSNNRLPSPMDDSSGMSFSSTSSKESVPVIKSDRNSNSTSEPGMQSTRGEKKSIDMDLF